MNFLIVYETERTWLGAVDSPVYCSRCGAENPDGSVFCAECNGMLNP